MAMSEPILKVRVDGSSGSIILNRPHRRNALNRAIIEDLGQALSDLHQERRVRTIILTGSGAVFSAGLDLHEMRTTVDEPDAITRWHEDAVAYRELLLSLLRFPKPIIAGINGPAIGAGAGLALACDILVAAESASLSVPAVRRGLVAGMVAPLLVFRLGGGPATPLLLCGREWDANTACQRGLFHEVTPEDLVWARCREISDECAAGAHEALAMTKRLLNETIGESLATQLTAGAAVTATSKTTEAAHEGMRAFVEKREPQWP